MTTGDNVRAEKIETIKDHGTKIVDGYWLEGYLLQDLIIGELIRILRTGNSENSMRLGAFTSTRIIDITPDKEDVIVKTKNSKYRISPL